MISVCVIVKDGMPHIGRLIDTIPAHWDTVIYDTGSTDGTQEAVAKFDGVKVYQGEWNDDFAQARTECVQFAHTEFVVILDADEILTPGSVEAIEGACKLPAFRVGMIPLVNAKSVDMSPEEAVNGGAISEPVMLPRVFKRTSDLRWFGRIHETVHPDWMREHGGPGHVFGIGGATIVHYGNAPIHGPGYLLDKLLRNIRLLMKQVAETPEYRTLMSGYLAKDLIRASSLLPLPGEPEKALELASELADLAFEEFINEEKIGHNATNILGLATAKCILDFHFQRYQSVVDTVWLVRARKQDHVNLCWFSAIALDHMGELQSAENELYRLLATKELGALEETVVPPVQVYYAIGSLKFQGGWYGAAVRWFEFAQAASEEPNPQIEGMIRSCWNALKEG